MTANFSSTLDLAQAEPFRLGAAEVHPALSEVIWEGGRVAVQHRVMQVLVVLGTHPDKVISRDVLIETCWGGRIVGDDAINRCISQLRKLAQQTGAFQVETIPRVGYRLTAGRPAVAWRRQASFAVVAVLGLALIGLGAWRLWPPTDERTLRVEVLNFRHAGGGEHTAELANYLVSDIAGVLAQSGIQTVASRPSGEIGLDQRKADLQIGGVVRADGARLKVRVFLNDPRANIVLWSNEFDRPTAEIDQLRTQVSAATAETLYTTLEPLQQKGLHLDPEVLAIYLRASEKIKNFNPLRAGEPRLAAEQVVARAPNFAAGHALLALTLINEARTSPDPSSAGSRVLIARAETEARTAIRIDPASAGPAYDARQFLQRLRAPHDLVKVEDLILDGLRRAPEFPFLHMRECRLLTEVGRVRDAMRYCERAMALRPFAAPINHSYAFAVYVSGDEELAREAITLAARLNPDQTVTRYRHFAIVALGGSPAEALALLQNAQARPIEIVQAGELALHAYFVARRTQTEADTRVAVGLLRAAAASKSVPPDLSIRMIATLGRTETALEMLSDPSFKIDASGAGFLLEPSMRDVRRDPRFWILAVRAGLVDYWTRRARWPDFCGVEVTLDSCRTEAAQAMRTVPLRHKADAQPSRVTIRTQ